MLNYKGDIGRLQRCRPRRLRLEQRSRQSCRQRLIGTLRPRRHAVHLGQHQRDVAARFPLPLGWRRLDGHAQSDRSLRLRRLGTASPSTTDHVFPAGTVFLADQQHVVPAARHRAEMVLARKDEHLRRIPSRRSGLQPRAARSPPTSILWQAGVIQKIENADMNLYSSTRIRTATSSATRHRRHQCAPIGKTDLERFQDLVTGAKINF